MNHCDEPFSYEFLCCVGCVMRVMRLLINLPIEFRLLSYSGTAGVSMIHNLSFLPLSSAACPLKMRVYTVSYAISVMFYNFGFFYWLTFSIPTAVLKNVAFCAVQTSYTTSSLQLTLQNHPLHLTAIPFCTSGWDKVWLLRKAGMLFWQPSNMFPGFIWGKPCCWFQYNGGLWFDALPLCTGESSWQCFGFPFFLSLFRALCTELGRAFDTDDAELLIGVK